MSSLTSTLFSGPIAEAQDVINAFKSDITYDPFNATAGWGDICADNSTFTCELNPYTNETGLAGIAINGYGLEGELTLDFLLELPDLVMFHGNSNNFTGTVPSDLSGLQWFYELDVSNNQLSGPFPEGVLTAPLTFLDLRFNYFEGEVPAAVFDQDLDVLFLNDNNFSGEIPDNMWSPSFLYLTLANNYFNGSIPEIDNASPLVEVLLSGNYLSGPLPSGWDNLANLTLFDAGNNLLTGDVPEALCGLSFDAGVGYLETLNLTANYFTDALGPICTEAKVNGTLDISGNCIVGEENQRPVEECVGVPGFVSA